MEDSLLDMGVHPMLSHAGHGCALALRKRLLLKDFNVCRKRAHAFSMPTTPCGDTFHPHRTTRPLRGYSPHLRCADAAVSAAWHPRPSPLQPHPDRPGAERAAVLHRDAGYAVYGVGVARLRRVRIGTAMRCSASPTDDVLGVRS